MATQGFFAYPSTPREVGEPIETAVREYFSSGNVTVLSWKNLDIVGHFIAAEVVSTIEESDFLVADISSLNFNVTYEIGYAIGQSKPIVLVKNKSIHSNDAKIQEVGIFDTLGYEKYENSLQLRDCVSKAKDKKPIEVFLEINQKAPVYFLDTPHKTDWSGRIVSRIKKAGYIFRNFDPAELPRLSANDAITQVAQSYGVVVPLLTENSEGYDVHNIRAAFIAGLAHGMGKSTCILQNGDSPVPLDYRDFVNVTYHPDDINEYIAIFASEVAQLFQSSVPVKETKQRSFLKSINLGATSAENEMRDLENYYLETDQYLKALRGEAHLVVGRKGSGKSAIFLQIRDTEREKSRSQNIILDLKPDGYKLVKFKERILSFLEEGTYQHTITAFWEYVLLLEICYKILEKDKHRHIRDHTLFDGYRALYQLYYSNDYDPEGDFSERMSGLMEKIYSEYEARYGEQGNNRLQSAEVTELLYKHDVRKIFDELSSYLEKKNNLWLLFDNLDKGWPTSGLKHEDLLIIRGLIDATQKIEKKFTKKNLQVHTVVFLRNDVYELLVKETSDRGKEASVLLDWTDSDLLRELVRLRIISNELEGIYEDMPFNEAWLKIFVSHYKGEETSRFLIERSLMRPRFLLNLINQCKSFAINLNHHKVYKEDIEKGLEAYSSDLLRDIGYELSDISGDAEGVLYCFIGSDSEISEEDIFEMLGRELNFECVQEVFDLLVWYGFLGIKTLKGDVKFIYNFNYNMSLMQGFKKKIDGRNMVINEAFWPALLIEG